MMKRDGRHEYKFTPDDADAFHERFCTLAFLERETGRHLPFIRAFLTRNGVHPFEASGQRFGSVYLRAAVDLVINQLC